MSFGKIYENFTYPLTHTHTHARAREKVFTLMLSIILLSGQDDNVRCHCCDGGLRNWEVNDIPWVEHARWFPKCEFVSAKKGVAFVNDVMQRFPTTPKVCDPVCVFNKYEWRYYIHVLFLIVIKEHT